MEPRLAAVPSHHPTAPAPTSFMVILLSTIGAMKEFAMIQALNGGGPGTSNVLIVQYIYQTGFQRPDRLRQRGVDSADGDPDGDRADPDAVREKEGPDVKNAASRSRARCPRSLWLLVVVYVFPAALVPPQLVQAGQRAVLASAALFPEDWTLEGYAHRLDAVRLLRATSSTRPSWRSPRPCSPCGQRCHRVRAGEVQAVVAQGILLCILATTMLPTEVIMPPPSSWSAISASTTPWPASSCRRSSPPPASSCSASTS